MKMTKEELEHIQRLNPIDDVIRGYIQLVPDGANYRADCPFCDSVDGFHVNCGRNIFHCFSCHCGGDVFTFVKDYRKISFKEAVELLS